jgi:hypothetical protein
MCDPPGVNVTSQKRNVMVQKINTIRQLTADQQSRSNIVVAASGFVMADGQSQDPMLAQVRLRNGDYAYVKDLPKIDHDDRQPNGDYMIPLVLNHSGDIKDQVGAVWLFIENNMLHALVAWTKNTIANEIKPIADDGFLQFSTEGYVDEVDADGKYGNFWISTLSPVTVGNDPATQVLNQNDGRILITNMIRFAKEGDPEMVKKDNEITPEEEQSIVDRVTQEVLAQLNTEEDAVENDVEGETPEVPETPGEDKKEEEVVANKISTTPKQVVNATPKQNIVRVNEAHAEQEELKAFSNALAVATRDRSGLSGVREAMNVYNTMVKKNIITGDDFLPTSLALTFFKGWLDNENASFIKFMNARSGAVYAGESDDTALGHVPGALKVNQDLNLRRRDLKATAVYKRLPIDAQDLFDDHNGELVKFRTQELASRIANQIIVAAVKGGNTPGSVGSTAGGGTRGLFGIIPDAEAVSGFGVNVATEVDGLSGEDPYAAVIRTIDQIAVTAGGNITSAGISSSNISLIVPTGWIASILLTKNSSGNYQFTRDNINSLLGISNLVMMPELVATQQIVAVADGAYQVYGENTPKLYTRFDDEYNQDVLLAEQFVAGSLAGYKQASVYTPFDASA